MTSQPRHRAGTQTAGVSAGGRFASKPVPTINSDLGFGVDPPRCGWTERTVKILGSETTFTRTVSEDGSVSVSTDCDDPTMMLLARKGDAGYWSGNTWSKDHRSRRVWSAEICRRMLEEGLVATSLSDGDPVRTAMLAASSPRSRTAGTGLTSIVPNALTIIVAQIRGLHLIESTAPADGWVTKLGGYDIPVQRHGLLFDCYNTAASVYRWLPPPPWVDTNPPGEVPWRRETIMGHTDVSCGYGPACFVGEHGDLVWRALTETTVDGMSPLKNKLMDRYNVTPSDWDLTAAAVLYDDEAAVQLTTDLFVGVEPSAQTSLRSQMLRLLDFGVNPQNHGMYTTRKVKESRWTVEQQNRLRSFTATVEALQPATVAEL